MPAVQVALGTAVTGVGKTCAARTLTSRLQAHKQRAGLPAKTPRVAMAYGSALQGQEKQHETYGSAREFGETANWRGLEVFLPLLEF